ncbi:MAG TPA: hypothetical protein VK895_10280 [Jiangellaceae bacterium]|nr:hypothetical protein [Jiangellaceae bacterium]
MPDPLMDVATGQRPVSERGDGSLEMQNAYPDSRTFEQAVREQNRELAAARTWEVSV